MAECLKKLREQLNALYPNRSKVSDGSIGDTAHSSRKSDHNPNSVGVVCAIDITHDPEDGVDCHWLAKQLFRANNSRWKYLIWNGMITTKDKSGWTRYNGANKHNHHLHISVAGSYDNRDAWILDATTPVQPVSEPVTATVRDLKIGDKGADVKALQEKLGVTADGNFGLNTKKAVLNVQVKHKLRADGIVGENTRKALGL